LLNQQPHQEVITMDFNSVAQAVKDEFYNDDDFKFADNSDDRCPVVLICDTSGSMYGHRIEALNQGLQRLFIELNRDTLTRRRVDLAIISCGGIGARVIQPMVTIQDIQDGKIPQLHASGGTPMDSALNLGMDIISERKSELRSNGVGYYKSLLVSITDGGFKISESTKNRLHDSENSNGHRMLPIGVGQGADARSLAQTSAGGLALMLDDVDFGELIEFLSSSLQSVTHSTPGQEISIALPEKMRVITL
jgi:uncharacterized protein YegL